MILTVTPNTGLDHVLFLPRLERNRRNQASDSVEAMGGKGCDVSLVLRELGVETVATGLAAGDTGRRMEAMLRAAGVVCDFVWTGGQTRLNTVIIENDVGGHTTLCAPGLEPDTQAWPALQGWIRRWTASAAVVVFAGSLPESWSPDRYGELVALAGDRPAIVDASGAALEAALPLRPWAVKPNRDELAAVTGQEPDPLAAARQLLARGARRVLASLGAEGALLVTEGGAWWAAALSVPVVNPAGAGDAATACLALGALRGWPEEEILRQAVAFSAAAVITRGTAEVHHADIDRLLPRVKVERL
jgi:1-phosphofructokinase family hexose kinase